MYGRKLLFIALWSIACISISRSQENRYVRIALQDSDFQSAAPWLDVDKGHQRDGKTIVELPADLLSDLDLKGVSYDLLVEDLTAYYQDQNRELSYRSDSDLCYIKTRQTPRNFQKGSMGGYLTLEELTAELDRMHEL